MGNIKVSKIKTNSRCNYLFKLGYALYSYYNSEQLLSQEQIELLANSSGDDIIEAMEYVLLNAKLKIFCMNTASISRVKRRKEKI